MAKFKLEDGTEIEAFTSDELKERIDTEVAGLKAKNGELLGLHAKEKERLKELEDSQRKLEEDRLKEKGEFKDLYEKTQSELETERETARKFRQMIQQKELESGANVIVSDLTTDSRRAELLKKEALQFAKYTDDGIKFEIGGVEVDAAKLKEKLAADYPFLCDGRGSSGGGAQGGSRNGEAGKNPFAKGEHFNLTEQGRLMKEDPALAAQLRASATT